jgi:hypothetical protein
MSLLDPTSPEFFGTISPDDAYQSAQGKKPLVFIILEGAGNLEIPAPLLWQASFADAWLFLNHQSLLLKSQTALI